MSAGGARPPLAPRAGPEARQRHHEKLIVQLESELSATVQRLEAQRTSQQEEVERLNRDLLAVCEDRQELRARADLAEQQVQTFREELQHQLALWAQERLELEKRAADAEAAANAARQSEGRIMAQAAALDSRIVAAQADRKHAQEKDRLRTELERRTASQADQITQLRDKLAQLSAQLAESARAKLEQEAETKRQISENATLVAENHRLAVASGEANKAREDLLAERERAYSTKASLESALRLNETREKQITALQDAVHAEREKSTRMENARLQEIDLLRHQVDSLQQQCKQTERLRAEQIASFQDQLREQRAHTLRLTEELSTLENRHQWDHARNDRTSSDGDVDVTNRVIHKALSGQKRHDVTSKATMRAQENDQSSFYISEAVDLNPRRHRSGNTGGTSVAATSDIDDNDDDYHHHDNNDAHNSLVSDYISRILDQTRDLDTSTHRFNESEDGFEGKTMHCIPGRRPPTAVSVPVARRSSKATAKTSKKQASRTATARPAAATRTALTPPSGLVNSRTKKIVKKKKKKANLATSATAVSKKTKKKTRQENGPLPMENQRKDPFDKLQVARWRF